MESRKPHLATLPGLILGCLVCCALWGSAFPCIKIGYALFGIPAHDSASQLLFAGLRFTLAGALVIVGMSAAQRRPLIPQARDIKPIFVLSLFQTIGQYFFFYLGLSRASAMSSSIIEASANFLAILFAALAFHTEKLNTAKVLGWRWALPASRSSTFRARTAPLALRSTARALSWLPLLQAPYRPA